jgi:hypothetical protein
MTDNTSTRTRPELKPLEVGVGAGAAVVTAFAASYLGTAGTLTGAALASVIGTVSTSLLRTSAERTNESLHRTAARLRQPRAGPELGGSAGRLPGTSAADGGGAGPAPDGEEAAGEQSAADRHQDAVNAVLAQPAVRTGRRLRWPVLAAGALIAFVVALIAITGVESALGKPLAAVVGKDDGSGTTVGRTLDEGPGKSTEAPASPAPTPTPSTGSSATTGDPSGSPSGTLSPTAEPTASATPGPTPRTAGVPSPAPSAGGGSAPGGAPSP